MANITVIVCTYNRCQSLAATLNSVAVQTFPQPAEWEILVVDNNSSDETKQLVEGFQRRYPERIRYLFEPQQGLSYARNAGIREARGDVIAFIDDDVTVEPQWLENLTTHLQDSEWAGAAGCIVPKWTCPPPRWLKLEGRYSLAPFVVCFNLGPEACQLTEAPFGANMAFRREMFEKYGEFRTDLGHCAGSMVGGEDTEFGDRLLGAGQRLRYEPSAVVYHPVPEHRVQKEYLLAWSFDAGVTHNRLYAAQPDTKWFVAGIPLYLFRRLAAWILRWLVAVEAARRFFCKLKVWRVAGMICESYRQSRGAKS